tara:strand:- start:272 stop:874 length:603 start_codon:yes stop_codon:yes gene_type:complete
VIGSHDLIQNFTIFYFHIVREHVVNSPSGVILSGVVEIRPKGVLFFFRIVLPPHIFQLSFLQYVFEAIPFFDGKPRILFVGTRMFQVLLRSRDIQITYNHDAFLDFLDFFQKGLIPVIDSVVKSFDFVTGVGRVHIEQTELLEFHHTDAPFGAILFESFERDAVFIKDSGARITWFFGGVLVYTVSLKLDMNRFIQFCFL